MSKVFTYLAIASLAIGASAAVAQSRSSSARVCVEHLPNCGRGMTQQEREAFLDMTPEQQAAAWDKARAEYEDQLRREAAKKASGSTGNDFLAKGGLGEQTGNGDDFLAGGGAGSGDFLRQAADKREAERKAERERVARLERRQREERRERARERERERERAAGRYGSVRVTSSNIDQLRIIANEQEATAPPPEYGHNYYLIGYWYCIYTGFDRGAEQRRTYSNVGRWDVTSRWIGVQSGTAMQALMPNPEIWDRPPRGYDNSACRPEWVVVERQDGDRALRQMNEKWLREISANRRVHRVGVANVLKWGRLKHPVER